MCRGNSRAWKQRNTRHLGSKSKSEQLTLHPSTPHDAAASRAVEGGRNVRIISSVLVQSYADKKESDRDRDGVEVI